MHARDTSFGAEDSDGSIPEERRATPSLAHAIQEPIAIVGMACRFPGAATIDDYWRLLITSADAIREVPPDRWDVGAYHHPDLSAQGKMNTRWGGFLPDIEQFDPSFFGISPREARNMDPQQRLLLEVAWEALEDAAIDAARLVGAPGGVYVGMCSEDYKQVQLERGGYEQMDPYFGLGNARAFAAGRLAYALGLRGPAVALDSACSASLVAVHLACQGLRTGDCDLALAGGVNIILAPSNTVMGSRIQLFSPDGRSKVFDARADGFARSEGCGVVALKRLRDALASGDPIRAVIRGSAVNQDGRSAGLTTPSACAQEIVLRKALANAGVAPAEVGFIEAHGTGTAVGDPLELEALVAVYGAPTPDGSRRPIGACKTNLGHLEAAAGVAGLIKAALALEHSAVPPNLHFEQPHPNVSLEGTPLFIPRAPHPWEAGEARRIAAVSSFGFSGTNAHLLLEEAPRREAPRPSVERPLHALCLSAQSAQALSALAARHEGHLAAIPDAALGDYAHTALTGRARFPHRAAVVAGSVAEMRTALAALARGSEDARVTAGAVDAEGPPRIALLLPDARTALRGAGRQLYETQPAVRRVLDACDRILRGRLPRPLLEVLFSEPGASDIDPPIVERPALFALQVAVAGLFRAWGIVPSAVLGSRAGDLAAAWVAGVIGLEEGLAIACELGRLEQAGAGAELDARALALEEGSSLRAPRIDWGSGTAGAILAAGEAPPSDLLRRLCACAEKAREEASEEVKEESADDLATSVRALGQRGHRVFIEIAPGAGVGKTSGARRIVAEEGALWLPLLGEGGEAWKPMLSALSALWVRGVEIDGEGFDRDYPRRRIGLPTYPFDRSRHWITSVTSASGATAPTAQPAAGKPPAAAPRARPLDAVPAAERSRAIERLLATEITAVLAQPRAALEPARTLAELGMDSLKLLDIKRRLDEALGVDIPTALLLGSPSIAELTSIVTALVAERAAPSAPRKAPPAAPAPRADADRPANRPKKKAATAASDPRRALLAAELLSEAAEQRVTLWAEKDQLRFRVLRGMLGDDFREALIAHKAELLAHLQGHVDRARGTAVALRSFTFNVLREKCYVCDSRGEAVIVDPGCHDEAEQQLLFDYVEANGLSVKRLLLTHAHHDHLYGAAAVARRFGVPLEMHAADVPLLKTLEAQARSVRMTIELPPDPGRLLAAGEIIAFGEGRLRVAHTPGHTPGSICFIDDAGGYVLGGDLLFRGMIGSSTLPGGSRDELIASIQRELLVLDDATVVCPGHGQATTIGTERKSNRFIARECCPSWSTEDAAAHPPRAKDGARG